VRFSQRQYPGASTSEVEAWWRHAPWSFRIARDAAGTAAGFSSVTELQRVPSQLVGWDPIDQAWRDDLVSRPLQPGQLVTAQRFERADPDDPFSEEVHAALALELMRTWMELRPAIRRHYFVGRQAPHEWSGYLEIEPLPGSPVIVDGVARYVAVLDFGSGSVDGWLTRIIANELQVEEDSILDIVAHQLVIGDERIALTKLEFDIFKYLYERPGAVVERAALLRDVWGYDYAGGSNVVEALITSLRRKLGGRATAIETVRGIGYRFDASGLSSERIS
jgi:DNA-binding winged helix-turn-helix (wHTH) protein